MSTPPPGTELAAFLENADHEARTVEQRIATAFGPEAAGVLGQWLEATTQTLFTVMNEPFAALLRTIEREQRRPAGESDRQRMRRSERWREAIAAEQLRLHLDAGFEADHFSAGFNRWAAPLGGLSAPLGELVAHAEAPPETVAELFNLALTPLSIALAIMKEHGQLVNGSFDVTEAEASTLASFERTTHRVREVEQELVLPRLRLAVFALYGGLLVEIQERLTARGYGIGPIEPWLYEGRRDEIDMSLSPGRVAKVSLRATALVARAHACLRTDDAEGAWKASCEGLRQLWTDPAAHKVASRDGEPFLATLTRIRLTAAMMRAEPHWRAGAFGEALPHYEQLFSSTSLPPPTAAFACQEAPAGLLARAVLRAIYVDERSSGRVIPSARRVLQQAIWFWGRFLHRRYAPESEERWLRGEGLANEDEAAFRLLELYCATYRPEIQQTAAPLSDEPNSTWLAAAVDLVLDPDGRGAELDPATYHFSDASLLDRGFADLYARAVAPHSVESGQPVVQLARRTVRARRLWIAATLGIGLVILGALGVAGYFGGSAIYRAYVAPAARTSGATTEPP